MIMMFGGRAPKIPTTFPLATAANGRPLTTEREVADNVQLHFAQVEKGRVTYRGGVRNRYNKRIPLLADDTPRDNGKLLTKYSCVSLLRSIPGGRAPGPDGLVHDLMKPAPIQITGDILPLLTKVSMATREALAFKDGRM
eukprot:7747012-Pyramimonas_sp.AAC.1